MKNFYDLMMWVIAKKRCFRNDNDVPHIVMDDYDMIHFVCGDKFTEGYIKFLTLYFPDVKQLFIATSSPFEKQYKSLPYTLVFQSFTEAMSKKEIMQMTQKAKGIVFSGIWESLYAMAISPKWLVKKSFFQFWGGDFYSYRSKDGNIKSKIIRKVMYNTLIKNCNLAKGLIFLIYGEEEVFRTIIPINHSRVYVAPMPGVPGRTNNIDVLINSSKKKRLSIGNSATIENRHFDVFDKLSRKIIWGKEENIEVCVPLSYGDMNYRDEVESYGKRIFGKKLKCLKKYMSFNEYLKYLMSCDVGIFNNDRQQGMGNINILLQLGKKVYINAHTSMWKHYCNLGCKIYDVNNLEYENIDDVFEFSVSYAKQNHDLIQLYYSDKNKIKQWRIIYDQALK